MKMSRWLVLLALGAGSVAVRAADATTPIDYTQRNAPFTPGRTVAPAKQAPAANRATQQDKRVEKTEFEKTTAPLADRRAGIDVTETREKQVRANDAQRPAVNDRKTSSYDHQTANVSTGADTTRPPMVARYQDSLTAASAANMARFPAVERATTAKINRFVFRKNPADAAPTGDGTRIVPAAGGSTLQK
ncbi:MAG: hypothetical protein JNL92_03485 [Opitutaceae bacterium]|nr:hypothetical protein [Opitutaceae bacterium]